MDEDAHGRRSNTRAPAATAGEGDVSAIGNLEDPPPAVSPADAARAAREVFGLVPSEVEALPGERDRNFGLTAADGERFVLKVVHPGEDPGISEFQTQVLVHLSPHLLPLPAVVPPADGRRPFIALDGAPAGECMVRCVTYLPGRRMADTDPSPRRWRALGQLLARLDLALEDFEHPMADRPFLWDLKRADRLRPLLTHIADPERRRRVTAIIDSFTHELKPRLRTQRSQVIHNDGNPQNVLVAVDDPDQIAGIIDFGDAVHAPLVQEIAVAVAYQSLGEPAPFRAALEITRGYHEISPLTVEEVSLVPELVATRLAVTTAITSWRSALHPENAAYIMRNDATIGANLALIDELCSPNGSDRFVSSVLDRHPSTSRVA
jgi:hydroxylysine kinase